MIGAFVISLVLPPQVRPFFPVGFLGYLGLFIAGQIFYLHPVRLPTWIVVLILVGNVIIIALGSAFISVDFRHHRTIFSMISAVAIFMFVLQIQIPEKLHSIIHFFVPLTLGVYLIHSAYLYPVYLQVNKLLDKCGGYMDFLNIPLTGTIAFILSAITSYVILKIPYLRRVV